MKRTQIKQHNRKVIKQVREPLITKINLPHYYLVRIGYKELAIRLNTIKLLSSRGNHWTFRSLYRMMQHQNVALHTIQQSINNGH
jgi:hypothetical protein